MDKKYPIRNLHKKFEMERNLQRPLWLYNIIYNIVYY